MLRPLRFHFVVCLLGVTGVLTWLSQVSADEPLKYNRDIRPILAENCFACHGADSAARKADLRLDQHETAVEMEAIVPGKPEQSELLARLMSDDHDLLMPPAETKKKLTTVEIETLRRWIAEGAEYEPHWSFIRPTRPNLPSESNPDFLAQAGTWLKNPIDQFVLEKLEANGLQPAPPADPRTLFRRLCFDITGLPPKPEQVDAFVDDYAKRNDLALHDWIDRLMSTPAWGEHRARYWLDAARYGDTHGMHFDNYREMWPYRDWVIRSFNVNQPFDQFTLEQLAGDLLPQPTTDQLVATGFQRCNITTNEGGTIDEENQALYATDRVQTFGWVYLGLTTNCAQCHDHKFDPITARDYYSLAAFFRNTTQPAKDGNVKDGRGPSMVVPVGADRDRWEKLPAEIGTAVGHREQRKKAAANHFQKWLATTDAEALIGDIPQQGLVGHALLNEGQGQSVASLVPAGTSYTASGPVEWVNDGQLGSAAVLKAGATFDLGATGDFEKNQAFSYGAWVRAKGSLGGAGIIGRMDEQANFRGFDLWQQGLSLAVHLVDSWPGNAIKVSTPKAVLKPGKWQHVLATYDGSGKPGGIKIYVDGKSVRLRTDTNNLKPDASIRTSTPMRIGQRSQGAVFQDGSVQDFRLYDRALSADEVMVLAETAAAIAILEIPAVQRTDEQTTSLFEYYLNTDDPEYPSLVQAVRELENEKRAIESRSPVTHIQKEKKGSVAMANILMRGEYDKPGDQVTALTPAFLHPLPEGAAPNRLALARWLMDPANPLTARVTVNRFWQQLFGQGLVVTTEDFGVMGSLPTHPQLLDWLAVEFRESNWDVKHIFKLMLTSSTYLQSAATTPEKIRADRDNQWLSRGPRFRMDAEMIRDNALAASGLLSNTMYGPSVRPYQPGDIWNIVGLPGGDTRNYVQDKGDNLYRRTLYTFWKRMAPPPNLEAFNAPSREVCTVRRERTNTPLQALVTLNDPQFVEAARNLAAQALSQSELDDDQRLQVIVKRVLGRGATEHERQILLADKASYLAHYQSNEADAKALLAVGETPLDPTLDPAQLAAWTITCNQVLNLDETLTK